MFDDVPIQAWLVLLVVAMAVAPARYVMRHLGDSPSRRDITQPPEDLQWRTGRALAINTATLLALAAFAVFIFTPWARQVAQSALFWPLVIRAAGGLALGTAWRGVRAGKVQPLVRGVSRTFERTAQPRRFWASIAWNSAVGLGAIWASFTLFPDQGASTPEVMCRFESQKQRVGDIIDACTYAIREARTQRRSPEALLSARAAAYLVAGNWPPALDDLDEVVALSKGSFDAHLARGSAYLVAGMPDVALGDFNDAHRQRKHDPRPISMRAVAYAEMKDAVRARRDVAWLEKIDPNDPTGPNVEARLAIANGDRRATIRALSAILRADPDNVWALTQRQFKYHRLGDTAAMEADGDRLEQIMKRRMATDRN